MSKSGRNFSLRDIPWASGVFELEDAVCEHYDLSKVRDYRGLTEKQQEMLSNMECFWSNPAVTFAVISYLRRLSARRILQGVAWLKEAKVKGDRKVRGKL